MEYLGRLTTPAELKSSEHNLTAVREFSVPTNLKHLQQFMGLTSHYRRFIQNYAKIAHPLFALLQKGAQYQWTAECEVAFEIMKSKLLSPPILAYPDFKKDFVPVCYKPMLASLVLVQFCHKAKKTIDYTL